MKSKSPKTWMFLSRILHNIPLLSWTFYSASHYLTHSQRRLISRKHRVHEYLPWCSGTDRHERQGCTFYIHLASETEASLIFMCEQLYIIMGKRGVRPLLSSIWDQMAPQFAFFFLIFGKQYKICWKMNIQQYPHCCLMWKRMMW